MYKIYHDNVYIPFKNIISIVMVETKVIRLVPYRDTQAREATQRDAESVAATLFGTKVVGTPRVRLGYWYDLQQAGAPYNGSNALTFSSSSNEYGFPDAIAISINIPVNKTFSFYGIADYTPNPSLQAMQISQSSVSYPIIYLSPDLYTNEDHKVIFNGAMPANAPNDHVVITLYGTAATTDNIDILFEVAEQSAHA